MMSGSTHATLKQYHNSEPNFRERLFAGAKSDDGQDDWHLTQLDGSGLPELYKLSVWDATGQLLRAKGLKSVSRS